MFSNVFQKVKDFSLVHFVLIGILIFACCALLFPSRLPSFIALPVRMYIATLFVYTLYWIDDDLDTSMKPWLICAGFLAAGFSL